MTLPVPPISLANLFQPPTAEDWFVFLLNAAQTVGLPTTTWQPGSVERAMMQTFAQALQQSGVAESIIAQAGFLDFAANGSVTYTDATGTVVQLFVTPDPSVPAQNPTGLLGWLDVLADSVYDVRRILASPAGGELALVNTSLATYGPFDAGTYHVAQPLAAGTPTYANAAALTVAPSPVVGLVTATASSGGSVQLTVAAHGLVDGDLAFVLGVTGTIEANGAWFVTVVDANNLILDGSTFVHVFGGGGTVYRPTAAAFTADAPGTASNAQPETVTQAITSLIGVSVANPVVWLGDDTESNQAVANRCRLKLASVSPNGPKGAYAFYALSSITIGPTLSPPQHVSTAINRALVQGGGGSVKVTIANKGGVPIGSDVTATDAVIQTFAVPTSVTETTQAAVAHPVTIALNAWVRAADAARFAPIAIAAVDAYFAALPIGGVTDPGGGLPNTSVVPFNAVIGAVFNAAVAAQIQVQQLEGLLNGAAANVQLLLVPIPEVATISGVVAVTVIPV